MAARRRPDPRLVHQAQISGSLTRLRNHLREAHRIGELGEVEARHRAEWPELWETIDDLIDLVEHPPPPPGGGAAGAHLPGWRDGGRW